jgi:diguanylate cyclase (GGDEF)-like protein/PAS domain S-box-containing protein
MTMKSANTVTRVLLGFALISALYLTSLYNYLLFHTLVEVFSVIVMSSIFFLAWNTRSWMEDNYFLFIGIAFLFVSLIELVHTLAYKGMNIFEAYDANLPTQLWILARYMLSVSLLIAPVWLKKRFPVWPMIAAYLLLSIVSLWMVFSGNFPACYVEGTGLTNFKIASEYIIILIFAASIVTLLVNGRSFELSVLRALILFLVLSISAELAFTAYLGVYDAANLIGHIIMLVSYFLLYNALIRTGLKHPFDLVFRDLKRKEAALLRSQADLQKLFDSSPFPVVITTEADAHFLKVNQAALDTFELTAEELPYCTGLDFYAKPADRAKILHKLQERGMVKNELMEFKTRSGKLIWCLVNVTPIEFEGEYGLLSGMADITEQMRIQEDLQYLSTHDALTGAYNRTYFEAEMDRLQKGRRFPVSIIMLDTDDLKQINDTYGHARGDTLLQTLTNLVKDILRGEEVFARIGGDEFAILLPHAETKAARQVVARIKAKLEQHARENGAIPIKISIGLGVANEKENLAEALKRADANMYADKNVRKGNTKPLISE